MKAIHIVLIFLAGLVCETSFAAQRMGVLSGQSITLSPHGSSTLASRCMDKDDPAPTTNTRYVKVLNAYPGAVNLQIGDEKMSLQQALTKGYISISGLTEPGYSSRIIGEIRVINNTGKTVRLWIKDGIVLGESFQIPLEYFPKGYLNGNHTQYELWSHQKEYAVTKEVQQDLKLLGYYNGEINGSKSSCTRVYNEFARDHKLESSSNVYDMKSDLTKKIEIIGSRFYYFNTKRKLFLKDYFFPRSGVYVERDNLPDYFKAFQKDNGYPQTGILTPRQWKEFLIQDSILNVQSFEVLNQFARLGYYHSGDRSVAAVVIRFQRWNSLAVTEALDSMTLAAYNKEIDYFHESFRLLDYGDSFRDNMDDYILQYRLKHGMDSTILLGKEVREVLKKELEDATKLFNSCGYPDPVNNNLGVIVRDYQEKNNIQVTGVIDRVTRESLNKEIDDLKQLQEFTEGKFNNSELCMMYFNRDRHDRKYFKKQYDSQFIDFDCKKEKNLVANMLSARDKILVIVAKTDGDKVIAAVKDKETYVTGIEHLYALADKYNIKLIIYDDNYPKYYIGTRPSSVYHSERVSKILDLDKEYEYCLKLEPRKFSDTGVIAASIFSHKIENKNVKYSFCKKIIIPASIAGDLNDLHRKYLYIKGKDYRFNLPVDTELFD